MPSASDVKQHIEYRTLPDGTVEAVLTVSFPNGTKQQFAAKVDTDEIRRVEGAIIGAELAIAGYGPEVAALMEVGFNFGKLIKGVTKGVGKIAKAVATSKVFKLAATGLALAAPVLGPFAPAALAVSAGMGIASKLSSAGLAAARGAKNVAAAFTNAAQLDARRLGGTAANAAKLLASANDKRLKAEAIQDRAPAPKPAARPVARPAPRPAPVRAAAPAPRPAPVRAPAPAPARAPARALPQPQFQPQPSAPQSTDILAHARAGRVRSSDGSAVSPNELLNAHMTGRISWVQP
jgi:hypothetical protein